TATATAASAQASTAVPAAERKVYEAWMAWSAKQRFVGPQALQDYAKPAQLNRFDWYSAHGWRVAYPGDSKIYAPNDVPGKNMPADELDG
ncbi:MAG: hypothetical protein ABSG43_07140, partial [Solirubrobacteraceae bacterium]